MSEKDKGDEKTACNGYTADDSSGNACSNGVETDSSFTNHREGGGVRNKSPAAAKNEIGPGFIVDVDAQKKKKQLYHHHVVYPSRRRQQQSQQHNKNKNKNNQLLPKELSKSPIHPDIDISLTGHVMGTNVLQQGKQLPAEDDHDDSVGFAQSQQVDALSQLLVDYFGAMRKAGMQQQQQQQQSTTTTTTTTKTTSSSAEDAKKKHGEKLDGDDEGARSSSSTARLEEKVEAVSGDGGGGKKKRVSNGASCTTTTTTTTTRKKSSSDSKATQKNTSNKNKEKETPFPYYPLSSSVPGSQSVPQIIADECYKPTTRTTLSSKLRRLEEALELTHIPRLLIEASCPHRVVHTNAAFSKSVIKNTSNNIQRWMEKQNSPTVPETRTLWKALDDMIPPETATIPLSVYPVHGSSGTVSHYLIEPSSGGDESSSPSSRKRRRFEDIPSQAIG